MCGQDLYAAQFGGINSDDHVGKGFSRTYMLILGINGGHKSPAEDEIGTMYHDSAAVLLQDGKVVAAIEEERVNRIKHTTCFPGNAIRSCLTMLDLELKDLDVIAVNGEESWFKGVAVRDSIMDAAAPIILDGRDFIGRLFQLEFGTDVSEKLRFCHHHDAHSWSAYALSGYTESLVMSIDGLGDGYSGMISKAQNRDLEPLRHFTSDESLGLLYLNIIRLLGFGLFDEYKAMGLAPYGDAAVYARLFHDGFRLLPEGRYTIDQADGWVTRAQQAGILPQMRRMNCGFAKVHMDIAAGLQNMLEKIVMHVLTHFRCQTGLRNLCLAGGVAHNCTLNGRILYSGLFDEVFVQPASHDAGGALGAALSIAFQQDPLASVSEMPHVFLGNDIGTSSDIERELRIWSEFLSFDAVADISRAAAQLIATGAVIGWIQGRSEFGPRALGHRSIVADPRPASNKDRINAMVKKRESFRPFAPSVIEERVKEFFEVPNTRTRLSFMTFVLRVREPVRAMLGAVTHVDGTARVQTVSRADNPKYWSLLEEFGRITGVPVLLNTSFNNNTEPIVESLQDAITCFLTTDLDYLVVDSYVIRRKMRVEENPAMLRLVPSLANWSRLEQRNGYDVQKGRGNASCAIVSVKNGIKRQEISKGMFGILALADGIRSFEQLIENAPAECVISRSKMLGEAARIWTSRMINLNPLGTGHNASLEMSSIQAAHDNAL